MTPKTQGRSGHAGGKPIGSHRSASGETRPKGWRVSRFRCQRMSVEAAGYSTVTDFARLRGWSTSQPRRTAMW